jgi:hypothetical protein
LGIFFAKNRGRKDRTTDKDKNLNRRGRREKDFFIFLSSELFPKLQLILRGIRKLFIFVSGLALLAMFPVKDVNLMREGL